MEHKTGWTYLSSTQQGTIPQLYDNTGSPFLYNRSFFLAFNRIKSNNLQYTNESSYCILYAQQYCTCHKHCCIYYARAHAHTNQTGNYSIPLIDILETFIVYFHILNNSKLEWNFWCKTMNKRLLLHSNLLPIFYNLVLLSIINLLSALRAKIA